MSAHPGDPEIPDHWPMTAVERVRECEDDNARIRRALWRIIVAYEADKRDMPPGCFYLRLRISDAKEALGWEED
ncbi:MAG: hypothetical protein GF393_10635 [Armatimonadia bacterium]|nr:hypothetical protein [Armatimonadia bacterium]